MTENSNMQSDLQKDKKFQRDPHFISWQWPIVVLAAGCLLYYLIHISDHSLPKEVTIHEAIENTNLFSSERSRNTLRKLTKLGPRLAGSIQNEVHAPALIEHEVQEAQSNAHSSQSILLQRQKGSGAYFLGFKLGFTNIYDNIQNVLALLEGSDGNHSILINCHYDTVAASEGASDDGITCAVMLELLRVLSMQTLRLKHNVIFLFNGAEETPLQGAHMFLKHEWAKKARIHVTVGAAGSADVNFSSADACDRFVRRFHGRLVAACRLSVTVSN
ncbi:endoplasmic reticulum metallopeptidase 1-like [Arctopsyche grandis]|uniref:endoplasmic reticulum metallopeptidase 1-like n=1 Tax=Arctopsyche grandis TaxID=121162 RepID=UPI00406D8F00